MKAFKYMIRKGDERVIERVRRADGGEIVTRVDNRLAVAIHETQEEATALLKRLGAEEGDDMRWLDVADVRVLDLDTPKRLCLVEN